MIDIKIPEVGESITSGYLAQWLVTNGDIITAGQEILELETDKATLSVPADSAGKITLLAAEGDEVAVGQAVARVDETVTSDTEGSEPVQPDAVVDQKNNPVVQQDVQVVQLSPAVRNLVAEHKLDPSAITGTGKDGRITKEDVLNIINSEQPAARQVSTPAVRSAGSVTRKKMSRIRQKIAANLVQSKQNSALLTTFNEIDMSRIIELRSKYKEPFQKEYDVKLGFMSFFVKGVCAALAEYPELNATVDNEDIVYRHDLNIGIAVSTPKGLVTPVLRNADVLSFAAVEKSIAEFGVKAKEMKIVPDDLSGGTFTISNGGVFGSLLSTPIPPPSQSGVLGMHSIQERPVVVDGQIVVRPMMYVALTYDHRIVDGREAVGFLNIIKRCAEQPDRLLLGVYNV